MELTQDKFPVYCARCICKREKNPTQVQCILCRVANDNISNNKCAKYAFQKPVSITNFLKKCVPCAYVLLSVKKIALHALSSLPSLQYIESSSDNPVAWGLSWTQTTLVQVLAQPSRDSSAFGTSFSLSLSSTIWKKKFPVGIWVTYLAGLLSGQRR